MNNTALRKAIALIGSQAKFGKLCEVRQSHVSYWLKNRVPAERVLKIEKITNGEVTRYELRPDLYPPPSEGYGS